jgi:hypothetical protein
MSKARLLAPWVGEDSTRSAIYHCVSKSVQSFLSDVTAYIENHPESLAFMNSDLFDSSFPDDMFIQDMIYQLQN